MRTLEVTKDNKGRSRWYSITTSAYQDKDGQWIKRDAINRAVALGDLVHKELGHRGPLRYWHVTGLDFGLCDYQAALMNGKYLLESGTFFSEQHEAIVTKAAERGYKMSPGFVYPLGALQAQTDFELVGIFERSFLPNGRSSNEYTALLGGNLMHKQANVAYKEVSPTLLRQDKAQELTDLVGDRDFLTRLLSNVPALEQSAANAGAVAKETSDAPPAWFKAYADKVDTMYTLFATAAQNAAQPATTPPVQAATKADETVAVATEDATADDDDMGDVVAEIVGGVLAGIKAMMAEGAPAATEATKEATATHSPPVQAATTPQPAIDPRVAALTAQVDALSKQLKELSGDVPAAVGHRPTQSAGNVVAGAKEVQPDADTYALADKVLRGVVPQRPS